MQCPFCSKRIGVGDRYCPSCGKKVDITFEEIVRDHAASARARKAQERVRTSSSLLAVGVFLFALSVVVYFAIPAPPCVDAMPVYHVEVPAVEEMDVEEVEQAQFEIPK